MKTPWHLKVLYISTFLLRFAFSSLLVILAFYVPGESAGEKLLNIAIIAVPYPFAEMVTASYFGIKSDRLGRKPIIVGGTVLAAFTVMAYAVTNDLWYLAIMHGIHGIGAAATIAPAIAMIADHAETTDRGRQMGWFDYSTLIGYVFGPLVGGLSIDFLDTRVAFLVMASVLFLSAFLLQTLVRSEVPRVTTHHYGNWNELRKVFKVREIRQIFPIWLIIAVLLGLAITYLPRIMLSGGITGTQMGLMFAAAGAALGLLQPFWGKVSDRVGRPPVMLYGILSIAGVILVLVLFPESVIASSESGSLELRAGIIPVALCGIGAGAFIPSALAMMADCTSDSCYGATMGLYSFALGFGAFIAEGMGLGIIIASGGDNAPLWLLYFAAVLILLAVGMAMLGLLKNAVTSILSRRPP